MENLKAAAEGENEEWTKLYPEFAKVAKEEGFDEVAAAFTKIAEVEQKHEARYKKLAENIENNKVFNKTKKSTGNAETADMYMKETAHRKNVPHVFIRRHFLSYWQKITNRNIEVIIKRSKSGNLSGFTSFYLSLSPASSKCFGF